MLTFVYDITEPNQHGSRFRNKAKLSNTVTKGREGQLRLRDRLKDNIIQHVKHRIEKLSYRGASLTGSS